MKLIQRILKEYGYKQDEYKDGISFHSKEDEDYYIVADYSKSELINFRENAISLKTYELMSKYKDTYKDISKNTSLFVCVKVDDYDSFIKDQRNEVYTIEENPYVFRKYVILYKDADQDSLFSKTTDDILQIAQRLDSFTEYENRDTRYNNSSYFLALQILVKIPFLELSKDAIELINLPARLSISLNNVQKSIVNDITDNEYDISDIDDQEVTSLESGTLLDQILDKIDHKIGEA